MGKRILLTIITLIIFSTVDFAANRRFTLVIDAGHGGHDAGAVGLISKEKDLTLKFALAFGKYIERKCPDVNVLYTRTTDKFLELRERAAYANRNNADLFVSVHINSIGSGSYAHGYQTWTLGMGARTGDKGIKMNLEIAKRENSVIYLEKDYKTSYKGFNPNSPESDIMFEFIADKNREQSTELARFLQDEIVSATGRQNGGAHQNNLAVLRLTSMPSCLMELGFISTPDEEEFLNSNEAVDLYSRGFYNAFVRYKNKYDSHLAVPYKVEKVDKVEMPQVVPEKYKKPVASVKKSEVEVKPATQPAKKTDDVSAPVFKIQILAASRQLSKGDAHFQGEDNFEVYQEGGLYKYTLGSSTDYNAIYRLRKTLLEKFPESFIIAFKDGKKCNVNDAIREFKANRNK